MNWLGTENICYFIQPYLQNLPPLIANNGKVPVSYMTTIGSSILGAVLGSIGYKRESKETEAFVREYVIPKMKRFKEFVETVTGIKLKSISILVRFS